MENKFERIRELLRSRAELQARLKLLPYDGTPEIKEISGGRYLYVRKREAGRLTSSYVGKFSDTLYQDLLRFALEARLLRKKIRAIEKALIKAGYAESELSLRVERNLEFARIDLKANIYDQAVLEGVATTFPQTETIIDNGKVSGMTATDVQKILNLKHAWEFILDKDVLLFKTDYDVLCRIAKLVNEGFYENGGRLRSVPVRIGGSFYVPPLPLEADVRQRIDDILLAKKKTVEKAIDLCLFCLKAQLFNDGNKRAAVIFANHYLIGQGEGLIVIPEKDVEEFRRLLTDYYDDEKNKTAVGKFMKTVCWRRFQ